MNNIEDLRGILHDLKSQSTNFNTGIKLLRQRLAENSDYPEIFLLMDESLQRIETIWGRLKNELNLK